MGAFTVTELKASPETRAMLSEILIEVVAGGGSVSFMHPLEPAVADAYWDEAHLYERLGFTLTGEVPDYALKPHGGLTGTLIYWKRIGPGQRREAE
ncbi:MAG: hypothetical protein ACHQ4F_16595 [Candidatus Dormibacteria bacterium]